MGWEPGPRPAGLANLWGAETRPEGLRGGSVPSSTLRAPQSSTPHPEAGSPAGLAGPRAGEPLTQPEAQLGVANRLLGGAEAR